ncbi:MAG: GNAT family N-acetyltransferase [Oscillospiraceae bacterium]|nr:GNAT family N-acetyltransferase [Oscillospiraceae bacterium]
MELHTERLRMRPFKKKDFAAVHSYARDQETTRYMVWGPNTEKETRDFIARTIETNKKLPRTQYDFALETRDGGCLIGACGLYLRDPGEAEAGWVLHKDFWKKGYMSEAASALVDFAFTALKLRRVYSRCNPANYGSWRVMENCGMQKEAHFRKIRKLRGDPDGPWQDEYVFAILFDDWLVMKSDTVSQHRLP